MFASFFVETRQYYSKQLPYVTCQPRHHHDTAASILDANSRAYTTQQAWETEWNSMGLASRLTLQVTQQIPY